MIWGAHLYYKMIYKFAKVYTNNTWHRYVQEYIPLAYFMRDLTNF